MTTTNGKPPPGVEIRAPDPEADMEAFDALPAPVRDALNEAPYQMASEYALEVGVEAFLAEYAEDTAGFTPPRPHARRPRTFR
jgi:hypothetical protein